MENKFWILICILLSCAIGFSACSWYELQDIVTTEAIEEEQVSETLASEIAFAEEYLETSSAFNEETDPTEITAVNENTVLETEEAKAIDLSLYQQYICSIIFVNRQEYVLPETYIDVSKDGDGSVVAWLELNEQKQLYNMYVAADSSIVAPENCAYLFADFGSLEEINFNNCFDTSNVIDMSGMFADCHRLKTLDISSFDTQNVQNMNRMFAQMGSLERLNISGLNTSKVVDMSYMFDYCTSLTELDLSSFDTTRVENMEGMFFSCMSLKNVDVQSFDTSNVLNMGLMFSGCYELEKLDVSRFDTSSVTDMIAMFEMCSSLKKLDLSNFDTSNVMDMMCMFRYCDKLQYLDISSFAFNWWEETDLPGDLFMGVPESATIKLPQGYRR